MCGKEVVEVDQEESAGGSAAWTDDYIVVKG